MFAAGLLAIAVPGSPVGAVSSTPWTVQSSSLPDMSQIAAVSCPSVSVCLAVGGNAGQAFVLKSTDGGLSWANQPVNTVLYAPLASLSCWSAEDCVAATRWKGGQIIQTQNGGATWTEMSEPDSYFGEPYIASISCASSTACVAVGSQGPPELGEPESHPLVWSLDGGGDWVDDTGGLSPLPVFFGLPPPTEAWIGPAQVTSTRTTFRAARRSTASLWTARVSRRPSTVA
jgi:hypothetical protein